MGKCRIVSGGENGKYTIEIIRDINRVRWMIQNRSIMKKTLNNVTIPSLTAKKSEAKSILNAAKNNINNLINAGASVNSLKVAARSNSRAMKDYIEADFNLSFAQLRLKSAEKEIELLQQSLEEIVLENVWCADLTENLAEDLEKNLATIEVPGERVENKVFIRPAYNGGADFDKDRDGQLQPVYGNTCASAFYSAAMFPGWQRWRPQYRTGRIIYIAEDKSLCTVKLYKAISTAQSKDVNPPSNILSNVSFRYMTCDGAAFEKGDEVIIEFTDRDWENPRVIGFMHDPKGCQFYLRFTLNGHTPTKSGYQVKMLYSDGTWSEAQTSTAGLVGPFTKIGDSAYAYIHYKRNTYEFFHYWQTVGQDDDWDYAGYMEIKNNRNCDWTPNNNWRYSYWSTNDPGAEHSPTYYKRVEWKKQDIDLYTLESSQEEIDGETYPVYTINFDGLYCLHYDLTITRHYTYWEYPSCDWDIDTQNTYTYTDRTRVGNVLGASCTGDWLSKVFVYNGTNYSSWANWQWYLSLADLGQQVIIADEDGLNPTFSQLTHKTGACITEANVFNADTDTYICAINLGLEIDPDEIVNWDSVRIGSYYMAGTPESQLLD